MEYDGREGGKGRQGMKIHFSRLYRLERRQEPCWISLPFAPGVFREGSGIRIWDNGKEIPVQSRVLSRHRDGSVKFLFLRFAADLPGNRGKDLTAEITESPSKADGGIRIRREDDRILVDGGEGGLHLTLREGGNALMESLWDGRKTYSQEQFIGPRLKDGNGTIYLPRYESWHVEEEGALAAVLRAEGTLLPEGENPAGEREVLRLETRITVYAEKTWMEVAFRLINSTSAPLHAVSLVFAVLSDTDSQYDDRLQKNGNREHGDSVGEGSVAAGGMIRKDGICETTGWNRLGETEKLFADSPVRCCVGSSNYRTNFAISGGEAVEKTVDTASIMAEANEHYIEVFYGTFFADRTDREGGVCATVFQAQQNYPKAVKSDRNGIYAMLVPEGMEQVILQSGMSREQRVQLHFHAPDESLAEIDNRSLIYQMPDRPWLDPDIYRDAGAAPDIFVPMDTTRASAFYLACNRKATQMRFASYVFDRHAARLKEINTYPAMDRFLTELNLQAAFPAYAKRQDGIPCSAAEWDQSAFYLVPQLQALIARYSPLGENAFYKYYLPVDNTVERALETL